ncbi:MAG TPA: UbiD family decarboxylase [Candidatus Binatia bacterium]|jgi:4-hydroxy-3-polyprenylbenzoate decarboxylase
MLWQDLREYLTRLEQLGELKRVNGADWEEDIGGITELMVERRGPALLFDEIKDYPKGYRVAANLFNTISRTAVAFGLDPDPSLGSVAQRSAKLMAELRPIAPEVIRSGPIQKNVLTGAEIDLYKFPTPKWHENDGGRYIGTGCCVIQQDPESGFTNVGAYRVAIHDKKTCAIFIEHGKHGDVIRRKYWSAAKKCPVVVSVGQEPILPALAGSRFYYSPEGVSELEVAGYLHKSPYPVFKGEFTGLPIPAFGEIAIEGFIPSAEEVMVPEGPFGEWTGYYAHGRRPETIIEVKAIYHRNDPIIFGAPPSRPIGGDYFANLGNEDLESMGRLEKAGIPGVKGIFTLAKPRLRALGLKQMYAGHVDDVIRVLVPGGEQYAGNAIWILVDDDIDITNTEEVLWAVATRCAPEHAVKVIAGTAVWQLDPRIPPADRSGPDKGGRKRYSAHNLVINACRPYEWIGDFPPVAVNSPELRQRIFTKWKNLFEET